MKYDFVEDVMRVDATSYPLKDYRKWLMENHEPLVIGHFIKAISSGGRTKFTYDWQSIYFIAEEYDIVSNYIKQLHDSN